MSEQYGIPDHKAESNTTANSQVKLAIRPAVINVFFDGTGNNIFNTDKFAQMSAAEQARHKRKKTSYANAKSNVGLMFEDAQDQKPLNAVYIDGMGTTREEDDSSLGNALGMGNTGIVTRARSAYTEIGKIFKYNLKNKIPAMCAINVYGFSRGAATARHFVHLLKERIDWPKEWQDMITEVNFVGLFDTVSSYGVVHSNDVGELHLNFGTGYAKKVVHLVAGEEYRANFAVTTIASAATAGIASYELTLPGAHSDIGGSYNSVEEETRNLTYSRNYVYQQGWFKPSDKLPAPPQPPTYAGEVQQYYDPQTHRRSVSGEYCKVAHSIMVDKVNEHLHSSTFTEPKASKHPDVLVLQTKLRAFAKDEAASNGKVWRLDEHAPPGKAQQVRRELLHVSFVEGDFVMHPRTVGNLPAREVVQG